MEDKHTTVGPARRFLKGLIRASYRIGAPYLYSRLEFPHLLNARGLLGEGVEVGVQQGDFSEWVLAHWKGAVLYSVDPWREFDKDIYQDTSNLPQSRQDEFYRQTAGRLARFGGRSRIVRATSAEAVKQFADRQLDFVYIDAQHHYEAVKEDIDLWAPKVRRGGILAGHDYLDGVVAGSLYGVKRAVAEFVARTGVRLQVSHESTFPSWFVTLV